MGRPLLSTLVAPAAPPLQVRIAEPEEYKPLACEHWSYFNSFDPDSDEFFEGENVVYEAFLSAEDIAERERLREESERVPSEQSSVPTVVRVPVSTQATVRSRLMDLRAARAEGNGVADVEAPVPAEDERPDLVSTTADDSSSSGSDMSSSGRASPTDLDQLDRALESARRQPGYNSWDHPELDDLDQQLMQDIGLARASPTLARSLPTSPTRASWLAESPVVFARPEGTFPPLGSDPVDIPTPASPIPHPAQAVSTTPMTPPGSVTPRFLTWSSGSRPRAIDMTTSPTPGSRAGSARASRMSLTYISPPALRVQQ